MKKTFVEVIERFRVAQIEAGKSDLTAKTYAHTLQSFADWLTTSNGDINNPTRFDVQSYITHLDEQGKSAVTIDKTYAAISVFADWLERGDIVRDIRKAEVRKQRNIAPKSLDRNERNRLLRDVERDGNTRNIAIVYMLLQTGLRVSELCALDKTDIVMSERKGQVNVRHGKGDVARSVPLPREARLYLQRYLETRTDINPALFLSRQGRITPRMVQYILGKYGIHPHMLRHTYCRDLVSNGVDIAVVAELAGHSDINVTRRYSKPTQDELHKVIDRVFS
ncbi:tyrosine-type recombinase/integrase [Alicyclobacillus contaminans]|uniref:tyrosine-type recombinase/integrase n=1 Tax=Alicyclobacillus contaminans TaxID=392016 RepID=UPI000479201C|nr:tyrosine-type recombinase/integrase [Alicyclobacillus contaminans]